MEEVDRFTLGVRFFYNDQQIDAIPPETYEGGHVDKEYVWENSGNHIVRVDLYDMEGSSGVLTYTFNMGTQSPFGQIFLYINNYWSFSFDWSCNLHLCPKEIKIQI